MADQRFFKTAGPFGHQDLASRLGGTVRSGDGDVELHDLRPLDGAGPQDLSFFGSAKYANALAQTKAGACLIKESDLEFMPPGIAAIIVDAPDMAYIDAVSVFFPEDLDRTVSPAANVHSSARLEEGVTIEPGAFIGAEAEIGTGTLVGANAVIGDGVKIGRDCRIFPNATIRFALIGDRVIIHPNVSIGADGFGFATTGLGHKRVPQIGRVIIQDDVEVGASSAIDRGAMDDTVIGEGTKIDNLVQIAHNCKIGRHCMITAMVGISGSTTLGDFVTMGGKVGVVDHVSIGDYAIIAARSGVTKDLAGGNVYAGFPAKPFREWQKEKAVIRRMTRKKK